MQTPLQLDILLQSYEGFVNAKNNLKQRNLNTVFANIPKTTLPTSVIFLLIMSHIFPHTGSHSFTFRQIIVKLFVVRGWGMEAVTVETIKYATGCPQKGAVYNRKPLFSGLSNVFAKIQNKM